MKTLLSALTIILLSGGLFAQDNVNSDQRKAIRKMIEKDFPEGKHIKISKLEDGGHEARFRLVKKGAPEGQAETDPTGSGKVSYDVVLKFNAEGKIVHDEFLPRK